MSHELNEQKKVVLAECLKMASSSWATEQRKGTIMGDLLATIQKENLRDAQYEAILIYLFLKEVGGDAPLYDLIKSGKLFEFLDLTSFIGEDIFQTTDHVGRFLVLYFKNAKIKFNLSDIEEPDDLLKEILDEFNYANFLYSLPMGAGKTFLIAMFIYLDHYLSQQYKGTEKESYYPKNHLIFIPNAKKNSIQPSLVTINQFDPSLFLGEVGVDLKKKVNLVVLDDAQSSKDELTKTNPNLFKIKRAFSKREEGHIFIVNAEKVIPSLVDEDLDFLSPARQTAVLNAKDLLQSFLEMESLGIFIDEAHHMYEKDSNEGAIKLRQTIDLIHQTHPIHYCVCLSGTPFLKKKRKIKQGSFTFSMEEIQDTVCFYPLIKAIGNFLKTPTIRSMVNNEFFITNALDEFFKNYNQTYSDGTKSKLAFYCIDSQHLYGEVLKKIQDWYQLHRPHLLDEEVLVYHSNIKGYPLPKEALDHFNNLDNPSSTYRIVLLIGVGTEGWNCKSLTGVALPREKSGKILVLQSTCRCLREVDSAKDEKAIIFLSEKNRAKLEEELLQMQGIHVASFLNANHEPLKQTKPYPIIKNKNAGESYLLSFNNIRKEFSAEIEPKDQVSVEKQLNDFSVAKFKDRHPFQEEYRDEVLSQEGFNVTKKGWVYELNEEEHQTHDFIDFLYAIVFASFGGVNYATLLEQRELMLNIFNEYQSSLSWFESHPEKNIHVSFYREIAKCFLQQKTYHEQLKTTKTEVTLLDWDFSKNPQPCLNVLASDLVMPMVDWDSMAFEGEGSYLHNQALIETSFSQTEGVNRDRLFHYYPYPLDSSYEKSFIEKILIREEFNREDLRIYYNGYTGHQNELSRFQIETDNGIYTPDFLIVKLFEGHIQRVLIIETKGLESEEFKVREEFVEKFFLTDKENSKTFDYLKIGEVNYESLEKVIKKLNTFLK